MKAPLSPRRHPRGFALVISITLMVLLALVAIAMLTLSSITLRTSGQGEAMATARANARLALVMALGELQKSLGPDRAITATSEVVAANPAKPNLTGVWDSWDFNPASGSPGYDQEKEQRFRRWLVSTPDPKAAEARGFATSGWSGKTVELVGRESLGGIDQASEKVIAGLVPVRNGKTQGAYAWHVADESVKARINSYRNPAVDSTLAGKRAALTGHRPDPSAISGLDFLPTDHNAAAFNEAEQSAGKLVQLHQADLLRQGSSIKPFRNHVSPYSLGVLSDVRHGGLKQDLTSIFEFAGSATSVALPSGLAANSRLYDTTHGITGISDPYWTTLTAYYNTFRSITNADSNPTFYQRPFENISINNLNPPRRFFPGPVIAKVEALFSYVTRDAHGNWVGTLGGVDPQMRFMGHLIYAPLVTLHNPYNINLSFDNLEIIIRNVPVAFQFVVNGAPQNSQPVPLTDMFVYGTDRTEKSFAMSIANWSSPTSSSVTGPIVMKPGQTLICGPYLHPNASFSNTQGTPFFDWQNNLTGYKVNTATGQVTVNPIKAKPGFVGSSVGFDVDWVTPTHFANGQQTDSNQGVLGLRPNDNFFINYTIQQPSVGLNTAFEVTAKLTANRRTFDYGGLNFVYRDNSTLQRFFGSRTFRYPTSGTTNVASTYVPNSDPISRHALAKPIGLFSAYARTTNGGVYETNRRTETPRALNALLDGRLAGKPYLFHNPARTVISMNLQNERPGSNSHELNFQQLLGSAEDVFEVGEDNRTPALTGNTLNKGIKSGSFLELPTGPMQTIADFRRSNALTTAYLPNFVQPVANSLVSPLMSTNGVKQTDSAVAAYELLDHSVLANHAFYDRFYFSTFATVGSNSPDATFDLFMNGTRPLPTQSFDPYLPSGRSLQQAKSELFNGSRPSDNARYLAAEYQMVRGPFNVNSTSIQAWKAVLASMSKSRVVTLWARSGALGERQTEKATFLGMSLVNGGLVNGPADAGIDNSRTNDWNGYRELDDADLEKLARAIVDQVRERGPFQSLSEFVNRRVGDPSEKTRMGALEAAIEKSGINSGMFPEQVPIELDHISSTSLYNYKSPEVSTGNPAAGAPGWISQGDLMRILEPTATVRSDTFVIRVCGEAWSSNGNTVLARAYAEAVVQRVPEYVDATNRPSVNVYTEATATDANKLFGRRMQIVGFRWLSSNEI